MSFKKQIASLIDLKTLITLSVTFALIYGFVVKMIDPKDFMMIALLVIGFYFNRDKPTQAIATTPDVITPEVEGKV